MSDLFKSIMDEKTSTSKANDKNPKPGKKVKILKKDSPGPVSKKNDEGPSEPNSVDEVMIAEKDLPSKSNDQSKGTKKDPKTQSNHEESLAKLASIMQDGFQNLQQLLGSCIENNEHYEEGEQEFLENEDLYEIEMPFEPDVGADMFQTLSEEIGTKGNVGPEVPDSLAKLSDKLLRGKVAALDRDKYLKPKNIEFLQAPQINKPVWGNLSYPTRTNDSALQAVQKDFLHSAIPTLNVMQKLYEARDDVGKLDVKDLIRSLSDSLAFVGSANVGMVKRRRQLLKKELPPNMHILCQDAVEFSGANLFGDSLSTDIKEVSELNKTSGQLRGRGRVFNRFRGRGSFRTFNRPFNAFKRGAGRGRYAKRFNPMGAQQQFKQTPLNRDGPSKI